MQFAEITFQWGIICAYQMLPIILKRDSILPDITYYEICNGYINNLRFYKLISRYVFNWETSKQK